MRCIARIMRSGRKYVPVWIRAWSRIWDSYEGKVSEVANQINDTYLKVNGQSDGVKSYDRMVDLLVSYRKTEQEGSR